MEAAGLSEGGALTLLLAALAKPLAQRAYRTFGKTSHLARVQRRNARKT